MKIITICFGLLLTLLGAVYYYFTGLAGEARWFPALLGVLITLFGFLQGRWPHKHALYGSLMLALLAFLGSIRSLFNLFTMLTGGQVAEPSVVIVRSIIGLGAIIFIGLGLFLIKDFWHGWKSFGQFLGDWVARVALTIFYFTVLVPFGLGVRLFADPLHIKKQPAELWRTRPTGDQKFEDVLRQF
ncbi:MAG: hypothetical protein JW953_01300 [Anaerolineae bacterium]|nr:hypothetical protein [Anaerolineae bacterium]